METEGTGGAGHRPRATDIPQFDFFFDMACVFGISKRGIFNNGVRRGGAVELFSQWS